MTNSAICHFSVRLWSVALLGMFRSPLLVQFAAQRLTARLIRNASTILDSSVKRPYCCDYLVPSTDRHVKMVVPVKADEETIIGFMNNIAVHREPTCRSTGTKAVDFLPFTQRVVQKGIEDGTTVMALDGDRLVGISVGTRAQLDRSEVVPPIVRSDYKEVIDSLEEWIPSRAARRVVAPAWDMESIVINFLPADVTEMLRLDLSSVDGEFLGGNLLKKMILEQCKIARGMGLQWVDGQATAAQSTRVGEAMGFTAVFKIPYDQMLDNGERVHKKVPLLGGPTHVTLVLGRIDHVIKTTEPQC